MLFPLHPCDTRPSASSTRSVPVPSMLASSRRTPVVNGAGRCWNSVFLELQRLRLALPLLVSLTWQNHNQRQIDLYKFTRPISSLQRSWLSALNWFHNILRHFHFENLQLSSSKNHREHILLHAQWKAALRALGFEVKKEDVQETQRFLGRPAFEGPWSQKIWIAQWYDETGEWAVSFITHVLVPSCWCFSWATCFWGSPLQLAQLDTGRSEVRKMLADIGKEPLSLARDFFVICKFWCFQDPSQPINFDEFCEMMKGRLPGLVGRRFSFQSKFLEGQVLRKMDSGTLDVAICSYCFPKGADAAVPQLHRMPDKNSRAEIDKARFMLWRDHLGDLQQKWLNEVIVVVIVVVGGGSSSSFFLSFSPLFFLFFLCCSIDFLTKSCSNSPMGPPLEVFALFDEDDKGKISFRNLKRIAQDRVNRTFLCCVVDPFFGTGTTSW